VSSKALNTCYSLSHRKFFYSEDTRSRFLEISVCFCQTAQRHIKEDRNFGDAARTSNLTFLL